MTKISPVNGHLLIEPIKHEDFIATQRDSYEEIGIVVSFDVNPFFYGTGEVKEIPIKAGDKVFFDSWLAAKYPKEGGKSDEFLWLVKWEDVRAVQEYVEPISEL